MSTTETTMKCTEGGLRAHTKPCTKPRAFIGCSVEAYPLAEAIQENLQKWCFPEIWDQGFINLSDAVIDALEQKLPQFGFAVFLLTPDDIAIVRGQVSPAPRDNLILEVGMAIGLLGMDRTFLVVPEALHLKLPTDILGVMLAKYNPQAPNKVADLASACRDIREAFRASSPRSRLIKALGGEIGGAVHPRHREKVEDLVDFTTSAVFAHGVIRRNWTIDITYDLSKLEDSVVVEKINWGYEFLSVMAEPISYPLRLYSSTEETDCLIAFTRMLPDGSREPVFDTDTTVDKSGLWMRRQQMASLEPGASYWNSLHFSQEQPVSQKNCYIHNSLASLDPVIGVQLKFCLPPYFRVDVLARGATLEPQIIGNQWNFGLPGWLLPWQMIEYMVRKEDMKA